MHSKQTKKERVIPNKNIHPSIHQFSKQILVMRVSHVLSFYYYYLFIYVIFE